jgi:hypothetical protein
MNKTIATRTIIGLFAIAALFLGYKWFEQVSKDPDFGSTDTTDMVVAVEYLDEGSQVVLFDVNGKKTVAPGYVAGSNDVDPVWRPDGQRVIFAGTRQGSSNDIYRWNVATGKVESKLKGSRSASSPYFGPPGWPNLGDSVLVLVGGNVFDLNPIDQKTRQLLPPQGFENTAEEAGSQLEALYEQLGTSFKSAKWGKDRKVLYTVMNRESDELFVVNIMEKMGDTPVGPIPVFAGQSIQFDVAPDGTVVVSVQGFEFPDETKIPAEMLVDGRAIKPYRNGLFALAVSDDGHVTPPVPLFVDHPELGIEPQELSAELRTEKAIPAGVNGVVAGIVTPGSVAEKIGVKVGDVVVSVGGAATTTFQSYIVALSSARLGIQVPIVFWSATEKANKTVMHAFGAESTMAIKDPVFSPDSKSIAAVVGYVVDKYTFDPRDLVVIPLQGGINAAARLLSGPVYEPSWHPSGRKLVFAMSGEGGDSQIYVIGVDGSGMKNVSGPGEFGAPKFSPYVKN